MTVNYRTPGVYREEIFQQPPARLLTGIPGFLGFADAVQEALPSVILLHRQEEFRDKLEGWEKGYLTDAVKGFFENGGTRCYVAVRPNSTQNREVQLKEAIADLAPFTDLDLVIVPDAMALADRDAALRVQRAVIEHCATGRVLRDRLTILDAWGGSTPEGVVDQCNSIRINQSEPLNAALYYPWIKNTQGRLIPPGGHIAGIFARSDQTRGVFKAPANEEVRDAIDLETAIDNSIQDILNPQGINSLRFFPGRGIRVWGARTLSQDSHWRYVNIRRIFLTLNRWIEINLQWATFEPNSPQLWLRIQRELNSYLTQLWQAGALQGQTAEQAFYVKCDAETNPSEIREIGQVITEIGLAPNSSAEFIIVQITQRSENLNLVIT